MQKNQVDQNVVDFVADFITDDLGVFDEKGAVEPTAPANTGMLVETAPSPPKKRTKPRMKSPPVKNRNPFGESLMRDLESMMCEDVPTEGLLDSVGSLFGGGKQATQPAQTAQPAAKPAAKTFQFDQKSFQDAGHFANTIISQLSKVLHPAYASHLNSKRGGVPNFKKALMSYWGRAASSMQASLQDGAGLEAMTQTIKKIADDILNS